MSSTEVGVAVTEQARTIGHYVVTDQGEVYSEQYQSVHFGGYTRNRRKIKRRITYRYGIAEIWLVINEKRVRYRLDRLVAELFLGGRGMDWKVKHLNGDKLDCRLENLEWVERRKAK